MQQNLKRFSLTALLLQAVLQLIHSAPGEDISTARNSFLTGENSDFLGSFAGKFYSLIPESPFDWSFNLMLMQSTLVICAIILWIQNLNLKGKHFVALLILQSIFLTFGSQQSRDGTFFSFVFFGLAILRRSQDNTSPIRRYFYELISCFSIIFGLSFRPWLSPALVILAIAIKLQTKKLRDLKSLEIFSYVAVLLCAPLIIEASSSHLLKTTSRYPFQTVIIHDLSSIACLAANTNSINKAIKALEPVSNNNNLASTLCQFYRPNTWQAVANKNSEDMTTINLIEPIQLTTSKIAFDALRSNWITLLRSDTRSYLQIKLMLSSQVIFASQTKLSFNTNSKIAHLIPSHFSSVLTLLFKAASIPWIISSKLYVITPGMFIIIFFSLKRRFEINRGSQITAFLTFCSALISTVLTVLLFVSDNGRYLTPILLVCYLLLILALSRVKD
jgi:hypothetical protein